MNNNVTNNTSGDSGGGSSGDNQPWKNKGKSFKGQCSELEGSTIDIGGNSVSQCNETIKVTLNHIGREHQQGFHVKKSLQNLELEEPERPTAPDDDVEEDDVERQICDEEIKSHVRDGRKCRENMRQAHSLMLGQCSQAVEVKIRSFPEHEKTENDEDSIGLLKTLNKLMCKQEDTRCYCETHVKTNVKLSLCSQGDKSLHQCPEEFKNTIKQAKGHGTESGNEEKIRKNCVQANDDYEAGFLPANLHEEEVNEDGTQDFRDEEELDQQEQDMRATEEWTRRSKALADATKQEMCPHTFFKKCQ